MKYAVSSVLALLSITLASHAAQAAQVAEKPCIRDKNGKLDQSLGVDVDQVMEIAQRAREKDNGKKKTKPRAANLNGSAPGIAKMHHDPTDGMGGPSGSQSDVTFGRH